jgi:hypothetical protein
LISCGSSRSIKIATRSPALGLNTVFNRRERLNGGKLSGTVSFVWAIIGVEFRSRAGVSQRKYLLYVTDPVTDPRHPKRRKIESTFGATPLVGRTPVGQNIVAGA